MRPFYPLRPAYRHGADTPWGGDALFRLFGKDIPDGRTGEALEASTLEGLESVTEDGRTLTEVAGGGLPLLLKLLDAREALSVQVHPDDAYAARHENGKRGKTEAWVILDAAPGAKLVYGVKPGTDVSALSGRDIEACLRYVEVSPGDVLFIPAGMVHAVGAGIVLYEIQQASDVTYRFWDWGRLGADGKPRALHLLQAAEVARADLQLDPVAGEAAAAEGGTVTRYLHTEHFTLDRLSVRGAMALPAAGGFRFVTALCAAELFTQAERALLSPGQTAFLPAGARGVRVRAQGDLLVSGEGKGR